MSSETGGGEREFVPSPTWFCRMRFMLDFVTWKQQLITFSSNSRSNLGKWLIVGIRFRQMVASRGENCFYGEELMLDIFL